MRESVSPAKIVRDAEPTTMAKRIFTALDCDVCGRLARIFFLLGS